MATLAVQKEIILENSPVEFALIGPLRAHRGVYARSVGSTLDLIGLDSEGFGFEGDEVSRRLGARSGRAILPDLFPYSTQSASLETYTVRAIAKRKVVTEQGPDERYSEMSFSWRGLATPADIDLITRRFQYMANDITSAVRRSRTEEFQWHIAPLILLCQKCTEKRLTYVSSRRNVFWLALVSYVIVAAVLLAAYLLSGTVGEGVVNLLVPEASRVDRGS